MFSAEPMNETRMGPFARERIKNASRLIESAVAAAFAVPIGDLRAPTRRSAPIAFARQNAMYLAHVVLSLNYSEVGRAFGRDRTTAAYACRLVESRRDDPALDATLCALEKVIDSLLASTAPMAEAHQ